MQKTVSVSTLRPPESSIRRDGGDPPRRRWFPRRVPVATAFGSSIHRILIEALLARHHNRRKRTCLERDPPEGAFRSLGAEDERDVVHEASWHVLSRDSL